MNAAQVAINGTRARRKRAELAGSVGAGTLGTGLGVVLANYLRGTGVLLVVVGTALHASRMWERRRLERSEGERPLWWEALFYWSCWAVLAGLFVYVGTRLGRR
jgi:hypothetical protein